MSGKNTPVSNRCNKPTRNANANWTPTQAPSNSNEIRRVAARNLMDRNHKSTPLKEESTAGVLNTAFRSSQQPAVGNGPQNSAGSTPRFKPKSANLNACYTPSSLYRNTKSTPGTSVQWKIARKPERNESNEIHDTEERNNGEASNLIVAVRVRPLNEMECMRPSTSNVVRVRGNELTVMTGASADASAGVTHTFSYDHVFYSCDPKSRRFADQVSVFNSTALPLIERAFEGYNACLFAYGQTGSGKSYSMMGIEVLDDASLPHPDAGIIPRFCYELFRRIEAVKNRFHAEIEVSYFEIYNEKIHDLLCIAQADAHYGGNATNTPGSSIGTPVGHKPALKVREHPILGPYVVDLSVHPVDSYEALRNWLAVGNSQRATAATGMNDKSSRSHSIFNIVVNLTDIVESGNLSPTGSSSSSATGSDGVTTGTENKPLRQTRRSKISLVDLAGSERINSSANGDRIREGVSINKSLLTLGKVIAALSEAKKSSAGFVPYRESVLTWLLRENLGGNSRTVMLATISPASVHIEETLATLRYACQARSIVNRVKVNESAHERIIRELRTEVGRLKSLQNEYERQRRVSANNNQASRKLIIQTSVDESEVEALRLQLAQRERELDRAQKSWMERLREAEDLRKSEMRLLRRKGLALELSVEQKQACLVNLTADPILSGTLFYLLPPGRVKVGRTRSAYYATQPDIVLDGPLVARHHCIIENESGKLFITPQDNEFETYLNGDLLRSRQEMFHGDRLVIGGSHYFRISNPFCTNRRQERVVDFQLAHQEILQKQEEKLRREVEEEKLAALSRIEMERIENERNFQERLEKLELEQFKYECNRDLLETQRQALEVENARRLSSDLAYESKTSTPALKSSTKLLDVINNIMQTPSEESLHKTQLMVKEATQLCRNFGLNYEFQHSQVLDEVGFFRTVILILDRAKQQKAEWPVARLSVWLDIIRDAQNLDEETIFNSVDIVWKDIENDPNETLNITASSSKISLNLSIVKDIFQRSPRVLRNFASPKSSFSASGNSESPGNFQTRKPQHLAKAALLNCASPLPRQTNKLLTYDEEDVDRETNSSPKESVKSVEKSPKSRDFFSLASAHLREMQRSALRLKRLCEQSNQERENQSPVDHFSSARPEQVLSESVAKLEDLLFGMRACLEQSTPATNSRSTPKSVRFLID